MSTPSSDDIRKWDRWFAAEFNGQAWDLSEQAERTPAEAEKMLHAAHAAAVHWSRIGTELHAARADLLLAQVHAILRNGTFAMTYAQRSFNYLTSIDSPDWELAFAHAILAHAALAAGEQPLYLERHATASALGEAIADPEDKEIFDKTFRHIPAPAALD
jgi:hypothetical protein